ncbi:hypothetical protein BG005_008029 [Podila minutissima]|nr:hypothetical protein BG005_008029 [Podila minutissima]
MLGLVFLILTAVVAAQTKPPKETFATFITTERKNRIASGTSTPSRTGTSSTSGGGVSRWFNRNILAPLAGLRVPEHTVTDYYFFQIATLLDGSGQYLGAFHQWWTISELQEVGGPGGSAGASNAQTGLLETQAEARKQEAVQAKIKKDYIGAGKAYVDTAKLLEKSGTPFSLMEAASAYEEAFKAYNMAKQTGPALQCLEKAANLFRTHERGGSRAAKVFSQLGDLLKSQDANRAITMYQEAIELFKSEGDGRSLHVSIQLAELFCVVHEFSKAYALYKDTIIPETLCQDILQYTTRDHILNAVLAHLGATRGDWIALEKDIDQYEDICPDFRASRGNKLLRGLARAEREHDGAAFQRACQEFDQLSSKGMPDWQVGLLLGEKKKLEAGELL